MRMLGKAGRSRALSSSLILVAGSEPAYDLRDLVLGIRRDVGGGSHDLPACKPVFALRDTMAHLQPFWRKPRGGIDVERNAATHHRRFQFVTVGHPRHGLSALRREVRLDRLERAGAERIGRKLIPPL